MRPRWRSSLSSSKRSIKSERERLAWLAPRLKEIARRFTAVADEQRKLGFTDNDGLRRRLRDNGTAVERVISQSMAAIGESEARRLLVPLLAMQRYEAEQRIQSTSSFANPVCARI